MSTVFPSPGGYLGRTPDAKLPEVLVIDNQPRQLYKTTVHKFKLSDVDDPDLYAAAPLYDWEHSESGKWIMEHAVEAPQWHRHDDPMSFTTDYAITAVLKEQDYAFWILKFT